MVKRCILLPVWMLAVSAFALDITGLRTEDYRNPVGIDKSSIHFSWQLQSEQRGVMQTSYSLQIASDAAFGNVVWESGTVNSDQSVYVEASGFTPASQTRYYWRVTVSDNKGETATSTEKAYQTTDGAVYDLGGRRIGSSFLTLNSSFNKGIKIIGNRKVLKK